MNPNLTNPNRTNSKMNPNSADAGHSHAHAHNNVDEAFQKRVREDALATDREDLMAVLLLRFGSIPQAVQDQIDAITDGTNLERLVLVAANVPSFSKFVEELGEGKEAFRLVGESFNPLSEA